MQSACVLLYCHLWPLRLHHISPHYLINGTILGKRFSKIKCVSWFLLQLCLKHFLFQEEFSEVLLQKYMGLHVKYPLFLSDCNEIWTCSTVFLKYTPVLNFTKIYPVGVVLLHEDGRVEKGRDRETDRQTDRHTDRHDAANSLSLFAVLWMRLRSVEKRLTVL